MELREWTDLPEKMRTKEVRRYYNILMKRSGWFKMKRIIDIVVSVVGLVVLAIPMIVIAVMIKKDSEGPVFFKQERVTQYGRILFLKSSSPLMDFVEGVDHIRQYSISNFAL